MKKRKSSLGFGLRKGFLNINGKVKCHMESILRCHCPNDHNARLNCCKPCHLKQEEHHVRTNINNLTANLRKSFVTFHLCSAWELCVAHRWVLETKFLNWKPTLMESSFSALPASCRNMHLCLRSENTQFK